MLTNLGRLSRELVSLALLPVRCYSDERVYDQVDYDRHLSPTFRHIQSRSSSDICVMVVLFITSAMPDLGQSWSIAEKI